MSLLEKGSSAHLKHLDFSLGIELKVTVPLESTLNELPEFGREAWVVQVVYSQSRSGRLGRVSWSDTLLRGANGRASKLNLLQSIDNLVEAEDEVSSVGDEQSVGTFQSLSLKSVELVEQGWDVDDNTGTDERIALLVDQTCIRYSAIIDVESPASSPLGKRLKA
jgi:hypothetical protein